MFKRYDPKIISNPTCSEALTDIDVEDFRYYDKDGFELNIAEQKFYRKMKYPIDDPILNHCCWQENWFELVPGDHNLRLDHSMVLHRCDYSGDALSQLKTLKNQIPDASLLIQTTRKWGFDFALDYIDDDGKIIEILHIEYDSRDYDKFKQKLLWFEFLVRHTDWVDSAKKVIAHKSEWENLVGFDQNDWKSKFLIGWNSSEHVEKSLT